MEPSTTLHLVQAVFTALLAAVLGLSVRRAFARLSSERASRALQEARFRAAADAMLESLYVLRAVRDEAGEVVDGIYLDVNAGAERRLRRTRAELLGKRISEVVPRVIFEAALPELRRMVNSTTTVTSEIKSQFPGEEPRWHRTRAARIGRDEVAITASDVTELHHQRDALAQSEALFRGFAQASPVGIFVTGAAGGCTYVNDTWSKLTGISPADAQGDGWCAGLHPDDREAVSAAWRHATETRIAFDLEYRVGQPGRYRTVLGSAAPLGPNGEWVGAIVDISERKEAEEALARSEAGFRAMIERTAVGVLVRRGETIVYANQALGRCLGLRDASELTGRSVLDFVVRPSPAELRARMAEVDGGRAASMSIPGVQLRHADGSVVVMDGDGVEITFEGAPAVVVMLRDLTATQRSLREKETLLQEIHHRVKNNLQVVSSLLRLQSRRIGDAGLKATFDEAEGRVRSIALLHERLYKSDDVAEVEVGSYLRTLFQHLQRAQGRPARFVVDAQGACLPLEAAQPVALIANELLTNVLKYAFVDAVVAEPLIRVDVRCEGGVFSLRVADNGKGLPRELDLAAPASFGFTLVRSLCRQLGAELSIDGSAGTTVAITFPLASSLSRRAAA